MPFNIVKLKCQSNSYLFHPLLTTTHLAHFSQSHQYNLQQIMGPQHLQHKCQYIIVFYLLHYNITTLMRKQKDKNIYYEMSVHAASSQPESSCTLQQIPKSVYETVVRILRQNVPENKKIRASKTSIFYIDPLTFTMSMWNFIIIFTSYFLAFQISLTLAFGPQFWQNERHKLIYKTIYIILLILLIIDMVVNLNKGYYAFGYGKVISDSQLIWNRYLKTYFFFDLVCLGLLIIPLFISEYGINFLQMISIVLLLIKKFKCQYEIRRKLQNQPNMRFIFIFGLLGCDLFLIGNFGACIFLGLDLYLWKISFYGNQLQYYWLSNNADYSVNLIGGPWYIQYIYAQQFSTGTISTLAPGPFGKNPIQISYALFVMIFFMLLASYVAEVIMINLANRQQIRIFHDSNIMKFSHFMQVKKISNSIRDRIHSFFQLIWEFQVKTQSQTKKGVVDKLPMILKEDLFSQLSFTHEINFIQYFQPSQEISNVLSFKIKSFIVDPNTLIFQMGQNLDSFGERYLYYFKNGISQYFFPVGKTKSIITLSNLSKLMGEYEFITKLSYSFCAQSVDLCVIQKISFSDMTQILNNFNLQEQYEMLKCKILFYNQLNLIYKNCLICDERHRQNRCGLVMIREDILQQLSYNTVKSKVELKREEYTRKIYKKEKKIHVYKDNTNKKIQKTKIQVEYMVQNLNNISDQVQNYQKYYIEYNLNPSTY